MLCKFISNDKGENDNEFKNEEDNKIGKVTLEEKTCAFSKRSLKKEPIVNNNVEKEPASHAFISNECISVRVSL